MQFAYRKKLRAHFFLVFHLPEFKQKLLTFKTSKQTLTVVLFWVGAGFRCGLRCTYFCLCAKKMNEYKSGYTACSHG